MKPGLVIFDCDGVLVDSEVASNEVIRDNLARYGLHLELPRVMQLFVGGTMEMVQQKARALGADLPDDWQDEVYGETFARLRQGVNPVAGIRAVLTGLEQADIAFCVASNGSEEKMQITMGHSDLWQLFQGRIFSAKTLNMAKPAPDLFLHAAKMFGIPPDNCIVIEDSVNGVLAARRAKMRCLGYAEHGDGQNLADQGAEVFRAMQDLPALIGIAGRGA